MTDITDDFDESQSYPNMSGGAPHAAAHPLARMGEPSPVPGAGPVFTPPPSPTSKLTQQVPPPQVQPGQASPTPTFSPSPQTFGTYVAPGPAPHHNMADQPVMSPAEAVAMARQGASAPQPAPPPAMPQPAVQPTPQPAPRPVPQPAPARPVQPRQHFEPTPEPVPQTFAPQMAPGAEAGYPHQHNQNQVPNDILAAYQRMPGLSIRLPTDGRFLPHGAVAFTMTGEVNVYPMRGADELLLKSPDALMSGFALESLLKSCVPDIKFPRLISNPDLDVLLLAIKAASQGNKMEVEFKCPSCERDAAMEIDLRHYLAGEQVPFPDSAIELDNGMTIFVRPFNLHNATQMGKTVFDEARLLQMAEANGNFEEQNLLSFQRMTEFEVLSFADCVLQIVVPEGVVNNKQQIMDFIPSLSARHLSKIKDRLTQMNAAGINKETPVECVHCHHQWSTEVEFNPASFFGVNS